MPPGGECATTTMRKPAYKCADFSATRCFTIAIDGPTVDKAVAIEDDDDSVSAGIITSNNSSSSRHAAVAPVATAHNNNTGSSSSSSSSSSHRISPRVHDSASKSLSSSRTSSLCSISSADTTATALPPLQAVPLAPLQPPASPSSRTRRQIFWRNVVRQFNFTNEHERQLLLSLTHGVDWMAMCVLPRNFIDRHREIFYLISTPEYQRSSSIQRDVTRTFSIFERRYDRSAIHTHQGALFRVLNAIAEAEDGYCQGMNFIAALFLVEGLDEADAYALFLYLLKKRHLARIYQRSSTFLDDYLEHFNLMFQRELPDLHRHMHETGFVVHLYGIEWFTTLFSLSTKPDLACAVFDLFFVGMHDIFLRMGLAILKLLEAKLMCMGFEDFLNEFKPLVRQIDPYQAILQALSFAANPLVRRSDEDTAAHIARAHFLLKTHQNESSGQPAPPKTFERHRTLPPQLVAAIVRGDCMHVQQYYNALLEHRASRSHAAVLANELLHYAVWSGRSAIALFAITRCGADVNNVDDTLLTPLHFAAIRNHPDVVRLLLVSGADPQAIGGRWAGSLEVTSSDRSDGGGLTPLATAQNWRFHDTAAVQLVMERAICLFCNTKLDKLAPLSKATCAHCLFAYCDRPFANCIARHQCPVRRRQYRTQPCLRLSDDANVNVLQPLTVDAAANGADDVDTRKLSDGILCSRFRNSSGALTALTTATDDSWSRRSSFCTSEASLPPLTPSLDITKHSQHGGDHGECTHNDDRTSINEMRGGGLWVHVAELFAVVPRSDCTHEEVNSSSNNSQEATLCEMRVPLHERVRVALTFPDRPEWYCNASGCHSVFAFFSQGLECSVCGGFFCSDDFQTKRKCCLRCDELQQRRQQRR